MRLVTADEMRQLERATIERFGVPSHVLMERAGAGATRVLLELLPHMRRRGCHALVCAGTGNNGGDGLVVARLLRRRGVRTEVVLLGRAASLKGDAALNLESYRRLGGDLREVTSDSDLGSVANQLRDTDVIVDAIFGTGLRREIRGIHAAVIDLINASGVPVLAVDLPSGIDADTGQLLGTAIEARATATFGFAKLGQALLPGAVMCGTLAVVDIGLAPESVAAFPETTSMLDVDAVRRFLPVRRADAHKGDCGHVLIIAGSHGKTGAAQLPTRAALRAGAGLVTLVGPASLYPIYAAGVLEAMTETLPDQDARMSFDRARLEELVRGKTSVVVGPGMGTHADTRRILLWLIRHARVPVVVDADALTALASDPSVLRRAKAPVLLTPHPGEMARLCGDATAVVQADRVGSARRFAVDHACTVVLKGARTVIAGHDSHVWINPTGNPGMATGGMGDVLCGILGGLLAQGLGPSEAARLGVFVHGEVADHVAGEGDMGLLASDIIDGLRAGLKRLRQPPEGLRNPG